jgi:hypothetical protein
MDEVLPYQRPVPGDGPGFIVRHEHGRDRERLIELTNSAIEELDDLRDYFDYRASNLRSFARDARKLAGLFHALKPDSPEVRVFLQIAARAIGAAGVRLLPGEAPLEVDLGRGPVTLPRLPNISGSLGLGDVVTGFHAAIATGDTIALDLLAQAPLDRLNEAPRVTERCYLYHQARGLKTLLAGDRAGNGMLVAAMQGCNSSEMAQGERDYAQFLASPEIELILFHTMSDEQARRDGEAVFDERLRNALQMHRRYWSGFGPAPGQRWHDDPDGFIALGPLAAVAARQDAGLPVGLISDYLPRSVTNRNPQAAPEAASA